MLEKEDFIGRSKWDLDTPCLVLDRKLLQQNMLTMQAFVKSVKKNLRPHVKTHKCSKLAKLQLQTGSIGISCAKVSEAKQLANKGIRNILITSPVTVPKKIELLTTCFNEDPEITVVLDNIDNASLLNKIAEQTDHELNILVDIDPNVGRTGVNFDDAVAFAKRLQEFEFLNLRGIQCYAGNLQHITSYEERKKQSLELMTRAGEISLAFHQNKLGNEILTGSGTGTYDIDSSVDAFTELQPGSYTVMDAEYFNIESKNAKNFTTFKPAMTVLSTVISNNHPKWVTLDAGLKTLYYDKTLPRVIRPVNKQLSYEWGYGDEHGKLLNPESHNIALNTVVELMVAHCDPTINLFDYFFVTQDDVVIDVWPIDLRGKSQ